MSPGPTGDIVNYILPALRVGLQIYFLAQGNLSCISNTRCRISSISFPPGVYRLNVDNAQYVVVITSGGGTAIVRHR